MKSALESGELPLSVDGSCFPENPKRMSAHIIATRRKMKIGIVDFISKAAPIYRNACVAELCGALTIMKVIECVFYEFDINTKRECKITIFADYAALLNFIESLPTHTSFSSHACQIKNEIVVSLKD